MNNPTNKAIIGFLAALVIGFVAGYYWPAPQTPIKNHQLAERNPPSPPAVTHQETKFSEKHLNVIKNSRRLLINNITWTRQYIIALSNNSDDTDEIALRILKNQEESGAFLQEYYGDDVASTASNLLKENTQISFELINAIKNDDAEEIKIAEDKWKSNGNEIAALLSAANQKISRESANQRINEYFELIKKGVRARFAKNWTEDISIFDETLDFIIETADMLGRKIIDQFPEKFNS